jgi:large subunit ribosomal protein L5
MLANKINTDIKDQLIKGLNKKNPLSLPEIKKVVVNMRITDAKDDKGVIEPAIEELSVITGQKPVICKAKKSISGFKLRQGDPIGLKVTLRGRRMYDFIERLFSFVVPRLRDFRGLSARGFDDNYNYTIGFSEQTVFPEIQVDKVKKVRGLEVTLVTKAENLHEARLLLEKLGCVFAKEEDGK